MHIASRIVTYSQDEWLFQDSKYSVVVMQDEEPALVVEFMELTNAVEYYEGFLGNIAPRLSTQSPPFAETTMAFAVGIYSRRAAQFVKAVTMMSHNIADMTFDWKRDSFPQAQEAIETEE